MLNAVIKFALRHRPLIVAACLVTLAYGGYLATTMPIDVFPDLDRPRVTFMTECPGLAPEEVEAQVTFPIESSLLGASGVQDVRTQSGYALSVVTAEFDWGTDIRVARQVGQERFATIAGDLPPGVRPHMTPISSILGQSLIVGLRRQLGPMGGELVPVPDTSFYAKRVHTPNAAPRLYAWKVTDRQKPAAWEPVPVAGIAWQPPDLDGDQIVRATIAGAQRELIFPAEAKRARALRTLADWVLRPRLLKVPGVAQVAVLGGGRKQYQVLVDPTALHEYRVTLQDVESALRANNVNFTGGFADLGGVEKPIRVIGRLGPRPEAVVADLKIIPVKIPPLKAGAGEREPPTRPILLENVARVAEGSQVKRGEASVNGLNGVCLTITKQPHADTRAVTDACQAALANIAPALPADVVVEPRLYELREFIDRGVSNVGEALGFGALLILIVLFVFLLNVRTTFISLTAIPLSLVVTAAAFKLIGAVTGTELSINVMTLGGIAVAMGEYHLKMKARIG